MSIYLNTYDTEQGLMVAVADSDIVGNEFSEDGVSLEVSKEFYCGEVRDPEGIADVLVEATIANLVGERSVELGIDAGLIDEENVLRVEDVPHAQMVKI